MKIPIRIYFTFLIAISLCLSAHAKKEVPWSMPKKPEDLYRFFSYRPPQITLHHAQRAALYYHKVGEKKALQQFNRANGENEWNTHDFYRFLQIYNCEKDIFVTHPIIKSVLNKAGLLLKYKDSKGRQITLIGCNRLANHPEGSITSSTMFWAGVKGPSRQMLLMIPIPGTKYQAVTFLPTKKYTEAQLQDNLESWSLPEYNQLVEIYKNK